MSDADSTDALQLCVGALSRQELVCALSERGVRLNASAEVLLNSAAFDRQELETFPVVRRTVAQLGFNDGASLSSIFAGALEEGLSPCPPIAGPYLRLALTDQESAPDSVLCNGSAPSASITVAATPLRDDDSWPKGFYLRAVNGVLWLRGYRATDRHLWSPDDCFAFRLDFAETNRVGGGKSTGVGGVASSDRVIDRARTAERVESQGSRTASSEQSRAGVLPEFGQRIR